MNSDILKGILKQIKGQIRRDIGKMIDSPVDIASGNRMIFDGKIQERFGRAKIQAHLDF